MNVPHRYRAPTEDGTVLADPPFEKIGQLLSGNRSILNNPSILIDGTPLPEFRREAIAEIAAAARQYLRDCGEPVPDYADSPLLMSGHQPELTHVGVLVKTFALNGLARQHGLTPLNLIVDNDTTKNTAMRMAVFSSDRDARSVHLHSLPYDRYDGEIPYEERAIVEPELFRSVVERAMPLTKAWGFTPILPEFWNEMLRQWRRTPILGEIVSATRRTWERQWGCHNLEIPLSRLCATEAFHRFARHVVRDLPRFHAIYNDCVRDYRQRYGLRSRNHPVPDLSREGDLLEAPFWNLRKGDTKRGRLMVEPGELPAGTNLRSRALTTTMFLRLFLSDGFIHGIGGAKYDEVTDAIVNRWLGMEAPGFIVVTASLHLPLPHFPTTPSALHAVERMVRDTTWNPQRHLPAEALQKPEVRRIVAEKERLIATEPKGKAERKAWFGQLSSLTAQLRPFVAAELERVESERERCRLESQANSLLIRRDFAWCLFPEGVLREFCQRLM